MPDPNEVGALWKKSNERGRYLSVSLDIDKLLELNGGATGKVNLVAYPIAGEKANPNAPDLRLKFYAKKGPAPQRKVRVEEDEIPF
jgi:uncharacterized protein (DUF736 family)